MLHPAVKKLLHEGTVIPAHPLALTKDRKLDEARQRALTRYYMDAGVGGLAVGVHTTQFEIRDPMINLFKPVLEIAMEEMLRARSAQSFIKIGGICGPTIQAVEEAVLLKDLGYDLGLLSMGGLQHYSEEQLLERAKAVAEIIPVFGFYLQESIGGPYVSYEFWKEFSNLQNVYAIKIAPFDRYQTHEVVRAVCQSERNEEIALYTGNDDNIIADLLTTYRIHSSGKSIQKKIVGGLLGHWSVWAKTTVEMFKKIKSIRSEAAIPSELFTLGQEITDANAAFFDPHNDFKGSIAGIHEVLRRQGLLKGNWCLASDERLSPGQMEEIDRVYEQYPHLNDDDFIKENIHKWFEIL